MIYTGRSNLTCYRIEAKGHEVEFEEIKELLMQKPSNIIYIEKEERLCGVISTGDILRAYNNQKRTISINQKYTYVNENEYMKARKIFKENPKINELPIVDKDGKLVGDYARWNDYIVVSDIESINNKVSSTNFSDDMKKIVLVFPNKEFTKKVEIMKKWEKWLLSMGVDVRIVERGFLDKCEKGEIILFTDIDEYSGTNILYKCILDKELNNATTYYAFQKILFNKNRTVRKEYLGKCALRMLADKQIEILTLQGVDNGSRYAERLNEEIEEKYVKLGKKRGGPPILYKEWWESFFDDISDADYQCQVSAIEFSLHQTENYLELKDTKTRFYNVEHGERRTINQVENYNQTIWFFGPCIIVGKYAGDYYTIESCLQRKLNEEGYSIRVVNKGCWSEQSYLLNRIMETEFNTGDIIVVYEENRRYTGIANLNLMDVCEKNEVPSTWIVDNILHCNHRVNKLYADEIYKRLEKKLTKKDTIGDKIKLTMNYLGMEYIEKYFGDFDREAHGIVGSIVMNCNPFTKGHRYLIEVALRYVDYLIVFIVEEDKSLFTFEERIAMVKAGTRDLKNICIVPSGQCILSQRTFPQYFLKIEDKELQKNVEYDITYFAEQIAPKLNITYRFVGEEKNDRVTNEYNNAMKKILPRHGIKIIEIPRKKIDNEIISASAVRAQLELVNDRKLYDYIPETTKEILKLGWQ